MKYRLRENQNGQIIVQQRVHNTWREVVRYDNFETYKADTASSLPHPLTFRGPREQAQVIE